MRYDSMVLSCSLVNGVSTMVMCPLVYLIRWLQCFKNNIPKASKCASIACWANPPASALLILRISTCMFLKTLCRLFLVILICFCSDSFFIIFNVLFCCTNLNAFKRKFTSVCLWINIMLYYLSFWSEIVAMQNNPFRVNITACIVRPRIILWK